MRSFIFYFSFALVTASSFIHCVDIVFRLIDVHSPFHSTTYDFYIDIFGNPISPLFQKLIRIPTYIYYSFGGLTLLLMLRRGYIIATSKLDKIPSTYSGLLYGMVSLSIKGSIISYVMILIGSSLALTFAESLSLIFVVIGSLAIVLLPQLLTSSIVLIEISSFFGGANKP